MQSLRWSRPIGHDHYRNVRQSDPQIQHSQLDNWAADLRHRLPTAERFSATGFMEYAPRAHRPHYGLMLAAKITLPHFMVSSAISLAKSAGEPGSTVAPRLASRAWKLASARLALTCVFNLLMVSAGVFLGAPMPYQLLAS